MFESFKKFNYLCDEHCIVSLHSYLLHYSNCWLVWEKMAFSSSLKMLKLAFSFVAKFQHTLKFMKKSTLLTPFNWSPFQCSFMLNLATFRPLHSPKALLFNKEEIICVICYLSELQTQREHSQLPKLQLLSNLKYCSINFNYWWVYLSIKVQMKSIVKQRKCKFTTKKYTDLQLLVYLLWLCWKCWPGQEIL